MSLYWESSYEIVLSLMETFPELDVETVGVERLYQMVIALPDFADDPQMVNDKILEQLLREWYEETSA
ncbi:MAG: Fe-S cluster assembly protein IscX [Aggregatilineales bacterium]